MKEKELIALGFKREDVNEDGYSFYYYTYDFKEDLCLISTDDGEAKKEGLFVYFFDHDHIWFSNPEDLKTLIDLIKRNTVR